MPGTPALMFESALNPIKGWYEMAALDFRGRLADSVTVSPVNGGRVVHVASIGSDGVPEFSLGVQGNHMPLFLIQGSQDADVANPGTTAKGNFVHQSIAPTGIMSALVAKGSYELQTTEFDTDHTYSPGDLLTADTGDTDATDGGLLDNQNSGGTALTAPYVSGGTTDAICGVVSSGEKTNEHGVAALEFWPVYLPAGA